MGAVKSVEASYPTVVMFSGCKDSGSAADCAAGETAGFHLPLVRTDGAEAAGGACTSALIKAIGENPDQNWGQLIQSMKACLAEEEYTQIPTLNLTRKSRLLQSTFSPVNGNEDVAAGDQRRAVFIGINYVGSDSELSGCHNDVHQVKELFSTQYGYDWAERGSGEDGNPGKHVCRTLLDDNEHDMPTKENILEALRWLVDGARPGDSLFLHYSGHGGQVPDEGGDEADGMDEVLFPVDCFPDEGGHRLIQDDDLWDLLVRPLDGSGVKLVCIMDTDNSGTMLDLPYRYQDGDEEGNEFDDDPPPAAAFFWCGA